MISKDCMFAMRGDSIAQQPKQGSTPTWQDGAMILVDAWH